MSEIAKQLAYQKFIYKIRSSRLRKSRWELTLPLSEARKNDEIVSLAESQVLRWIDEINGVPNAAGQVTEIRCAIRAIRREENSVSNRRKLRQLYAELDKLQYEPNYMCLVIDRPRDYHRACRGFTVNNIKYVRLLGTSGGIKNSTIVFVSERCAHELRRRINNERNPDKEHVPAKLEAYKSLVCSASTPVSFPRGIAVVNDCTTKFKTDVIYLTNECEGEPQMSEPENKEIELNASDGCGLMLPSLAQRWSEELGLDYMTSGVNTRFAFEKGMAFTFDFAEFADTYANGNYIIKDAWGNDVDIRDVELVLTTSMVKLWDSYESCEDYVAKSLANGYTFAVTKTCPKKLENERTTNYQFLQGLPLDDAAIDELIAPTINEIRDVLGGDWRKTVLFLKGAGLNDRNVARLSDDYVKAIMVDREMVHDSFIQKSIYRLIHSRIDEAKIGVIKVHGNYSIASGDPISLCQSFMGLKVTGLLKAGEIYNGYWADLDADNLMCFRAPMTCASNIRMVHPSKSVGARHWYQYMSACTIFNSWDSAMPAMNGMDFDGDIVMLTDNKALVDNFIPQPALLCVQRKAEKKIPTEDDFINSNIASFGNNIGQITNRATSMYEIRSRFPKDSEEYRVLSYRICACQQLQQDEIDKSKGIISKPMPRAWYDYRAASSIKPEKRRNLYRAIIAEKKPYFMRYIYPPLMAEYNTYISNTNKNALREFKTTVPELEALCGDKLTERQRNFLKYYERFMPVGRSDCVMNKICRKFENEFDKYVSKHCAEHNFDPSIMKSDAEYSQSQYDAVYRAYNEYSRRLHDFSAMYAYVGRADDDEAGEKIAMMDDEFLRKCSVICPNRDALCNIVVDMAYRRNSTKRFAWTMCGHEIIRNLLNKHNNIITYFTLDANGDIEYCGNHFRTEYKRIDEGDAENGNSVERK